MLFLDSFTRALRPEATEPASRVLADAGIACTPRDGLCCGLTWASTSQLSIARRLMTRTVAALDHGDDRLTIVAEPSCAAALRCDVPALPAAPSAQRVAERVHTSTPGLSDLAGDGWGPPPLPENVILQTHRQESATFKGRRPRRPAAPPRRPEGRRGRGLLRARRRLRLRRTAPRHLLHRRRRPGPQSRLDALDTLEGRTVVSDGFSCATGIDHLTGDRNIRAQHAPSTSRNTSTPPPINQDTP